MRTISIGAKTRIEALKGKLYAHLAALERDGLTVRIAERERGNITFLGCDVVSSAKEPAGLLDAFKYRIASVLVDVILSDMEPDLMLKVVSDTYSYFTEDEKREIVKNALDILAREEGAAASPQLRTRRRNEILRRVLEYLDANSELVVEGFIRFRLKEYYDDLRGAVDRGVDKFMMDREYKEFIKLLKYFVDIQEPRIDEVHVVRRPGGLYRLLDSDRKVIENHYLEGFMIGVIGTDVDYDDLLLSALITVAPVKIILHLDASLTVAETIQSVFEGRVEVCPGCDLCRK